MTSNPSRQLLLKPSLQIGKCAFRKIYTSVLYHIVRLEFRSLTPELCSREYMPYNYLGHLQQSNNVNCVVLKLGMRKLCRGLDGLTKIIQSVNGKAASQRRVNLTHLPPSAVSYLPGDRHEPALPVTKFFIWWRLRPHRPIISSWGVGNIHERSPGDSNLVIQGTSQEPVVFKHGEGSATAGGLLGGMDI